MQEALDMVHDTFMRPVVYFQRPEETIVYSNQHHNFLFGDAPTSSEVATTVNSGEFNARIQWGAKQELYGNQSLSLLLEEGQVRVKVDATGRSILEDAERIVIDDIPCKRVTSARPHGLFTPKYYTFTLERVN